MEDCRFVKVFIIAVGVLLTPILSFAYSDASTHPGLTSEAIKFFNYSYPQITLNDEDIRSIKQGSIDEDIAPRWMHHFYDPVYDRGLYGFDSSKIWAQTTSPFGKIFGAVEKTFDGEFSDDFDYSWDRAIYDFVYKNRGRGLQALGHVLHLIEDKAVPEHTRNDPHLPIGSQKSDYEDWASRFNENNLKISQTLTGAGRKPIIFSSLGEYFDSLASYTNNSFFSKDTIIDKNYAKPIVGPDKNIEEMIFISGVDKNGNKTLLAQKQLSFDPIRLSFNEKYSINDSGHFVFTDNWNALSEEAVLHASGAIKLFFDEVEKEKQTGILAKRGESLVKNLYGSVLSVFVGKNYAGKITPIVYNPPEQSPGPIITPSPAPAPNPTPSIIPPQNQNNEELPVPAPTLPVIPLPPPVNPQPFQISMASPGFGGGAPPPPPEQTSQETEDDQGDSDPEIPELPPPPPPDTTPPEIIFSIAECADSNSPTSCFFIKETALNLFWSSSSTDFSYFEINLNGEISTTTATSTTAIAEINSEKTFSVRAVDTNGNWSLAEEKIIKVSPNPVVINEIAWAGTGPKTSADEWIELYNKSDEEISVEGWVLYSKADLGPYLKLTGSVPARGYYLIERTDDQTVSDIPADLTASFGNGLNNDWNEILNLSYASTTIDETPDCLVWCAGDRSSYSTMERQWLEQNGTIRSNWASNYLINNGLTATGTPIKGTPKARNSRSYFIANGQTYITEDITLKKENSPYVVSISPQFFSNNATLTIEPGVVIKFNDGGLIFDNGAKIIARGTEQEKIVFTAFRDDEYGGDLDRTSSPPYPSSWHGIKITSTSTVSVFDHTIIRYGGWWNNISNTARANLGIIGGDAEISNSKIDFSQVIGIKLENSNSKITNCVFENNKGEDSSGRGMALYAFYGSPVIQSNIFRENKDGIYLQSSNATVDSNIFENNTGMAFYSYGRLGEFKNNSGSGNGINSITIGGDVAPENESATLHPNPLPFYIWQGPLSVKASSTLNIEPGIIIKGSRIRSTSYLSVSGNLFIKGTAPGDVVFTSAYDDSVGGQIIKGNSNTPSTWDWGGIIFGTGSYSEISGISVSNAEIGLKYFNSPVNLSNSKISDNKLGIQIWGASDTANFSLSTIEFLNNNFDVSP